MTFQDADKKKKAGYMNFSSRFAFRTKENMRNNVYRKYLLLSCADNVASNSSYKQSLRTLGLQTDFQTDMSQPLGKIINSLHVNAEGVCTQEGTFKND